MKRLFVFTLGLAAGLAMGSAFAVDTDVLLTGNHATLVDQATQDIHNQADLDKFWDEAFGKETSKPKEPQVDFTKNMILAIFIGRQAHTGDKIRITKTEDATDAYNVTIEVSVPCEMHSEKVTNGIEPYIIASAPATAKPVNFQFKQHNEMC